MKRVLQIAAGLLVAVAVVAVYGTTLPPRHAAASMARYRQSPEALWAAVADFPGLATWRTGVTGVERLPDRDGQPVWLVHGEGESMPLVVVESEPSRWLKTLIPPDAGLPFGGTWAWQLSPADQGTVVTIIEDGEIYNPLFRALAHLVFGYHATLDEYLRDLGRKFGEEVEPQPVPQAVPAN
ncbi:MAG TPA: SRPBCC family protein [Planctomycetota bacterium]|nr:SRPBCC family protein [Planctomycetota bacterium]